MESTRSKSKPYVRSVNVMAALFSVLLLLGQFYSHSWAASAAPDIKVNGMDNTVTLASENTLTVTVELNAGEQTGEAADWWIVADTPMGWYCYEYPNGWYFGGESIRPAYQGALFNLTEPLEVLRVSGLPVGNYAFYFGVDTMVNGVVDGGSLFYDRATFEVVETESYDDSADSGTLVINEIVAKDADGGNDWIELYVTEGTVALGDYTIVDDDPDHEPQGLPDVSLSEGDFYIIEAIDDDDECAADTSCVSFKLGSDDAVTLFKNDVQVDTLDWAKGEADEGYSFGLLPDGIGAVQTLSPTKGYANETMVDSNIDFFSEDTVENVYINISETDWNSILASPLSEEYHSASITYRNITLDDVAFRTKGSSSLQAVAQMNSTRYSFKVDMNYYVDGQKLLGMKKINLNNNYKDPSYMRERIAYDMMRSLGIPTPRLSYVNLYINGSLHGLYTLVEQVDSEFLEENFNNPEGDLYKPDGTGSDLLWIGSDFAAYSGVELKTNEDSSDNAAFINMVDELNNGSDLESVIDVDGFLRYLAVSTALSNLDSYQGSLAHNYYIYEQDGVFSIIPWDFNESFGTFTMGCQNSNTMISLYIDEPTSGTLADRPLIAKLFEYEAYKTAYHGYIQDLIDGVMDPDVISSTITETKNLISEYVRSDPTAFYSYDEFEASLGDAMIGNIFGLQGFVDARAENMSGQLSGSEPSEGDGSGSCGGETAPNGPGGGFPMPPEGRMP